MDRGLVSADMLGDPSRLTGCDAFFAYSVEKRGFAMVYMAHDHYYRSPRYEVIGMIYAVIYKAFFNRYNDFHFNLASKLDCHECRRVMVDYI
jgi:hypothetical protein